MDNFMCEECGRTYRQVWTDAEARAEYETVFPAEFAAGEATVVVCDDCYRRIMVRP